MTVAGVEVGVVVTLLSVSRTWVLGFHAHIGKEIKPWATEGKGLLDE